MITAIFLLEGRKYFPGNAAGRKKLAMSVKKSCHSSGGTSVMDLAGSSALVAIGFGNDFQALINSLNMLSFLNYTL